MEISGKLRQLVNDTDSDNYIYDANDINKYIKNAIETLDGTYYQQFETDDGVAITPIPTRRHETIIAKQAAILVKQSEYSKQDRGSVKYRDAAQSIDTTNKAQSIAFHIDRMQKELDKLIKTDNMRKVVPLQGEWGDRSGNDSSPTTGDGSSGPKVPPTA